MDLAFVPNIRLGLTCLPERNTLAFMSIVVENKSFMILEEGEGKRVVKFKGATFLRKLKKIASTCRSKHEPIKNLA